MLILYGIKNCDTCRKAWQWLESAGTDYHFHDLRTDGLARAHIDKWIAALGWEKLLNRRSTTWRNLAESDKIDMTLEKAINLMLAYPTLIKRPVFELENTCLVGFDKAVMDRICLEL